MAETEQKPAVVGAHVDTPRDVANKSDKDHLLRAIRMSLDMESLTVRANTQHFNRGRYRAVADLPDYDALKDQARKIKEKSIANLPELIRILKSAVRAHGGHVFVANTAEDACRYILDVCHWRAAKLVVKGKSITSEEIRLNPILEADGIEVVESDLAEFILQLADEQPSHFLAPALHYSRERITALFKRKFKTDLALDTGEELTRFAREQLRDKFLYADVGVTGANLIAADTGTLMLVESEGNIRMASFLPPVHIAIVGVEKIIPTRQEMAPFLDLLSASAVGQRMAVYTSFLSPPLTDPAFALPGKPIKPREFHLVLIDNGRMRMRDDPVFRETLYCIRCSACLNSCANFQTVGGHAFGGETYSGGIGGSWEAGTSKIENARFSELCTGCTRCVNQCPVRIDIPWLNVNLGDRLNRIEERTPLGKALGSVTGAADEDRSAPISKIFFGNYHYFAKWGTRFAAISNAIAGGGKVASADRGRRRRHERQGRHDTRADGALAGCGSPAGAAGVPQADAGAGSAAHGSAFEQGARDQGGAVCRCFHELRHGQARAGDHRGFASARRGRGGERIGTGGASRAFAGNDCHGETACATRHDGVGFARQRWPGYCGGRAEFAVDVPARSSPFGGKQGTIREVSIAGL